MTNDIKINLVMPYSVGALQHDVDLDEDVRDLNERIMILRIVKVKSHIG